MSMHTERSPLAGTTVTINADLPNEGKGPHSFKVEDWWDHLTGRSWAVSDGNPAAMIYGMRSGIQGLPLDDEVLYGKVGLFGHLIHVSEIQEDDV
jgi:hypothetical protein